MSTLSLYDGAIWRHSDKLECGCTITSSESPVCKRFSQGESALKPWKCGWW